MAFFLPKLLMLACFILKLENIEKTNIFIFYLNIGETSSDKCFFKIGTALSAVINFVTSLPDIGIQYQTTNKALFLISFIEEKIMFHKKNNLICS